MWEKELSGCNKHKTILKRICNIVYKCGRYCDKCYLNLKHKYKTKSLKITFASWITKFTYPSSAPNSPLFGAPDIHDEIPYDNECLNGS